MAPIRVALIGLSSSAKTSWAAEGHLPYLLSPRGASHYVIVALLNSSISAAKAARDHFNLPSGTKTYGDPTELASDADVDLVVCCTRVDTHALTTGPSLRAGKAVFIEWPLVENYEEAIALTQGVPLDNNIIGLQGRVSPIVLKLKGILRSGRIGQVLSSDVRAYGNLFRRDAMREGLAYFADRKVGGNAVTISYAHAIDSVHETLGEFASFQSRMQIQRRTIAIDGEGGGGSQPTTRKTQTDVPDLLVAHGKLAPGKADVAEEATLSFFYRNGPQFKGAPGFVWTINGAAGEIMVKAASPYLQYDAHSGPIEIRIHDHATDEVIEVPWDWEAWQKELPNRARTVAVLYERYAHWRESGEGGTRDWPGLGDAVVRMRELDEVFRQYDAQRGE
ncbi:NAD(P)-binding protein [Durotheca rogersii]|uniref:NAD(P)-binding protein n=1 Tax=Durotheca rogersii TaxID=419775 RepID=UPI00222042EA|nr:NAD(P)-binding protein [Durotheca rogersii]KAI5857461.1 NAD(P)-binding protein [Durotheca rogersii]